MKDNSTITYPHYTKENIIQIEKLIEKESDYRELVNSLRDTRNGLYTILQNRPDLKENISRQFHALNNLIAALLPRNGYEYPPYE